MSKISYEDVRRFEEIRDEIEQLVHEAYRCLPEGITKERAKSYWYPHIVMELTRDHQWLGGSMCSMQDTLEELESLVDGEEEDE